MNNEQSERWKGIQWALSEASHCNVICTVAQPNALHNTYCSPPLLITMSSEILAEELENAKFYSQEKIPAEGEAIYNAALAYLTSEHHKKIRLDYNDSMPEYYAEADELAKILIDSGYSESNFYILIHNANSDKFEGPFVIGGILRGNGISFGTDPFGDADWQQILKEVESLPS